MTASRPVGSIKVALISDPHGDLVALRAVAADIDKQPGQFTGSPAMSSMPR
jgi:hypothetical protein